MRRREFITLIGSAAACPMAASGQQPGKIAHVGWLSPSLDLPFQLVAHQIFPSALRKLGFNEGQNLIIEHRRIDTGLVSAFAGANELVAAQADILVADGPEIALQAATAARPAVPVVMLAINYDPFERGYVQSLAQPGGNITGLFYRAPELAAKQIELLVEAFPERKRLAVLWDSVTEAPFRSAERAAQSMGLSFRSRKLENPPYDFSDAFQSIILEEPQLLLVLSSNYFAQQRTQIAEPAIKYRLPTMFTNKIYPEAGGLMSYGLDLAPMYGRAASYVAKILRGARAADLPIERAETFEFTLNLKTATALGVTLPTSTLLRADEVIE